MVAVTEECKFKLNFQNQKYNELQQQNQIFHRETKQIFNKQIIEKDNQINTLTQQINKLTNIFENQLQENRTAFQTQYDSIRNEYISHCKKTAIESENIKKNCQSTNLSLNKLKN